VNGLNGSQSGHLMSPACVGRSRTGLPAPARRTSPCLALCPTHSVITSIQHWAPSSRRWDRQVGLGGPLCVGGIAALACLCVHPLVACRCACFCLLLALPASRADCCDVSCAPLPPMFHLPRPPQLTLIRRRTASTRPTSRWCCPGTNAGGSTCRAPGRRRSG
jgi:hypothetical protein